MTDPIDLTGATVIRAHPGDRLTFIINRRLSLTAAEEYLRRLQAAIPGVHIALADDVAQVIHQRTDFPPEAGHRDAATDDTPATPTVGETNEA